MVDCAGAPSEALQMVCSSEWFTEVFCWQCGGKATSDLCVCVHDLLFGSKERVFIL